MVAHVIADRVADTATTTGTGSFTVSGSPPTGYQTISSVCATNDTFCYTIAHQSAAEWEVGIGTYSGSNVFARTTILASSNAGSAVSFSSGTKDVFLTRPAKGAVRLTRVVTASGAVTVTAADDIIVVNKTAGAATAVNLPSSPYVGLTFIIKDGKGDAATNNITITPASGNIDGSSTFIMDKNYQSCIVTYNGTEWNKITSSRAMLGLSSSDSPQFSTIELGAASDTTVARASAGVVSIEGETVHTNSTSRAVTASSIELGHATDTTIARSAAGRVTVEGSAVKLAGVETLYVPAAAMISRTTNGAASGTVEMTTNKNMFKTLDFDASTQEFAQFGVRMPKSWNEGTVTAAFTWSHASTTTNFGVVWALEAVAISDDDAGDVAFGTAQQVADTGGTTNDIYITGATSAITIAGTPQAEDLVMFQVKRVPADGSDTMAVDARLHGVTIYITTDAANDA